MAEAIGVVAASLEVGKAIIQAREKLQAIKSAPDEIRATLDDASRLSKLLTFLSRQQSRLSTNVQPIEELDAMNNLCQEAADDLLQYAKELNAEIQRAKWQGSFKIILKRKAIDQRKKTLESAKTSLGLAQQAFTHLQNYEQMIQMISTKTLVEAAMASGSSSRTTVPIQGLATNAVIQRNDFASDFQFTAVGDENTRRASPRTQYCFLTPTRLLGWSLQVQGWKYFDRWTVNFRVWNHKPDDSPIFRLTKDGNFEEVRRLLSLKQAFVTDLNSYDESALHIAAGNGFINIARLLINNGADVNQRNKWGNTCLRQHGLFLAVGSRILTTNLGFGKSQDFEAFLALLDDTGCDDFADNFKEILWLFSQQPYSQSVENHRSSVKVITKYACPPYKNLSLLQRLQNCMYTRFGDPEIFPQTLGHPITEKCLEPQEWLEQEPGEKGYTNIWILIARGMGAVMGDMVKWSRQGAREFQQVISANFLEGWREMLQQLIKFGGTEVFGNGSILEAFLMQHLMSVSLTYDFAGKSGDYLTKTAQTWIQELRKAGMRSFDFRNFAQHEVEMSTSKCFNRYSWRWQRCDTMDWWTCMFRVYKLETEADPTLWRVHGIWIVQPDRHNSFMKELSRHIPGAWGQDDEEERKEKNGEFKYYNEKDEELQSQGFTNDVSEDHWMPKVEVLDDGHVWSLKRRRLACCKFLGSSLRRVKRRIEFEHEQGLLPMR